MENSGKCKCNKSLMTKSRSAAARERNERLQRSPREFLEMTNKFTLLIVVMFSQVYTYFKLIKLYTLNMCIIVCQLYANKAYTFLNLKKDIRRTFFVLVSFFFFFFLNHENEVVSLLLWLSAYPSQGKTADFIFLQIVCLISWSDNISSFSQHLVCRELQDNPKVC